MRVHTNIKLLGLFENVHRLIQNILNHGALNYLVNLLGIVMG